MTRAPGAGAAAGLVVGVALAAALVGGCTQPSSTGLSTTPGPNATSSLAPPLDGSPGPSGSPAPSAPASPASGASRAPVLPSGSIAIPSGGLPIVSPPHDTVSDAPPAS